jgi:hypothetical protein
MELYLHSPTRLHGNNFTFYSPPSTCYSTVTESRRMRWTGRVACKGKTRNAYKIQLQILKDLKGRKMDCGEHCIMMNFITCILHVILLGWLNRGGWDGRDTWHARGRGEVFTGFWLGGRKGRDDWEDLGEGWRITLRWTLGRQGSMG